MTTGWGMVDDTGRDDTDASGETEDDLPYYTPPFGREEVPGFLDRLVAHLLAGETREAFTFEGVEVEESQGVWLLPLGGYDPDADESLQPNPPADLVVPEGGFAAYAEEWTEGVRRTLHEAWGAPMVRKPSLVGENQDPEGILDVVLVSVGIPEAEMWDRGDLYCVLVTNWDAEPRESMLRQAMVVLPREYAVGSLSALLPEEDMHNDLLMNGEHPLELRRRAWLLSTLFGAGEVRLRDVDTPASRFSLQSRSGVTTVWTFTDDGRILVLIQDPTSTFADEAPAQFLAEVAQQHGGDAADTADPSEREADLAEAWLILAARMLDRVPDDLRALIAARGEDARGEVAEHDLEFRMLGDEPVPVITGAVWFDGEHWCVSPSLMEIGRRNDFGMDDFGFGAAVRQPYRLGGALTVDEMSREGDERRTWFERVFAACPYPEQDRPSDTDRLGYAVPTSGDYHDLVADIERVTRAWWERSPEDADWADRTFEIGGRGLRDDHGRALRVVLASGEVWTVDALQAWADDLIGVMSERWGTAGEIHARNEKTGIDRRSPLTRVMRATGLLTAPLWWVNGHAVAVVAGTPDPSYGDDPEVIIVIARPDAVLDLARGSNPWELRIRARIISDVSVLVGGAPAPGPLPWNGPPLAGSSLVPDAMRGGFRTGDHFWTWYFTHDGRGLLLSHPTGPDAAARPEPSFEEQVALFCGVPDDLLSLVVDRDPGGFFPVVHRGPSAPGSAGTENLLAGAATLPAVHAVFWRDDVDWRASEGMLQRVRDALDPDDVDTTNPLETIYSEALGVPQLQWALRMGERMGPPTLLDASYASFVFDRVPEREEIEHVYAGLGVFPDLALTGTLNDLLDVVVDAPGYRFLLDAALSNPHPQRRRELALWLLDQRLDASSSLSFLSPVNVLFANPTLGAEDEPVLRRLLERGAIPGPTPVATLPEGHPFVQLLHRDIEETALAPLVRTLLVHGDVDPATPALPDGRSLLDFASGAFPHGRSRDALASAIRELVAGGAVDTDAEPER
ncbi:hypothetical protein AB0O70_00205 [Microbacterium paraoxydans]|uniref:hypothetical protein n=1 Tax=Microbacterium TaxID=33882 RepID=UPI001319F39B|nr:hypothetical protein [Microbacterium sp. str. 'China']